MEMVVKQKLAVVMAASVCIFYCLCYFSEARLTAGREQLLLSMKSEPFDAHCCHMGTDIKHLVPDWVKPSFIFLTSWHSDAHYK